MAGGWRGARARGWVQARGRFWGPTTFPHPPRTPLAMSWPDGFHLVDASDGDEDALAGVRLLFRAHAAMLLGLGVDIAAFQGFEEELAGLPGKYGREEGGAMVLLWYTGPDGRIPAGCVAIHRLPDGVAEIKRLFVDPVFRGKRLGELLSVHIMRVAAAMGYGRVCLDTLDRLPHAAALYTRLGFAPVPRYNDNPMPDVKFFGRDTAV